VRPRLLAELPVEARSTVWRTPTATWTVTTASELIVLDDGLTPVASFPLPADWPGTHAITLDATHAALSLPDRVALVDTAGRCRWEVRHTPWADDESGSTWVTPNGLVWAVVPGDGDTGLPDSWWVLDAACGEVLCDLPLRGQCSGSEPIGHARGVQLGASIAGGDGFRIYEGRHDASGITVTRMPGTGRILADVSRSGDRYLTTDRHQDVAVHSLVDGGVLVSRPAKEIFDADDLIDFRRLVTDERDIVRSVLEQQHFVLDATTLEVIEPVEYPEGAALDAVLPGRERHWVTTDWLDGRVQLWSL
jgi:hypothetical protein